MATYTLTTDGSANFIVIKNNQGISEQRQIISFKTLYKGNAENIKNKDELIKSQQKVNYLDCIKDGKDAMGIPACEILFRDLKLFPEAEIRDGEWIQFSKLAEMEKKLTELQKDRMDIKQVAKIKNMDDFLPGLDYAEALWESGLKVERVCKKDVVTKIKTFGSFIDPLEKEGYYEVPIPKNWPNIGDTIVIDANAMEAMGFGPSTLRAKRTSKEKVDNPYEFKLEIKCGTGMNVAGADNTITHGTDKYENYFAGNAEKGKLLKSGTRSEEKIKTIILKEWGDKMQVVIYFMKYYLNKSQSITMCAADKVVFMFCLMLNLPCVYTGYLDNEDRLPELRGKKIYSTVEYSPPKTALQMAQQKYDRTKEGILKNNNKLIEFMKMQLDDGKKKKIYIKGVGEANDIPDEFYTKLIEEVEKMNVQVKKVINRENVEELNKATTRIKNDNMVIVFFKLQGTKKNKKIYLLATQNKVTITKKLSTLVKGVNNFYNLLKSLKPAGTSSRRNVKMKGGAPGDITEEEEKDYEEMLGELPTIIKDDEDNISIEEGTYPTAKYYINENIEIDLQEELIKGVYGYYHDDEDKSKADIVYNYMLYDGILNNGNVMPSIDIGINPLKIEDIDPEYREAFKDGMEEKEEEEEEEEEKETKDFNDYIKKLEGEIFSEELQPGVGAFHSDRVTTNDKRIKAERKKRFQQRRIMIPSPPTHKEVETQSPSPVAGDGSAASPPHVSEPIEAPSYVAAQARPAERLRASQPFEYNQIVRRRGRAEMEYNPFSDDASTVGYPETNQLTSKPRSTGGKKRKRKTRKAKKKKKRKTRRKRKTNTKKKKTRRKIKKRNRKTKRKVKEEN